MAGPPKERKKRETKPKAAIPSLGKIIGSIVPGLGGAPVTEELPPLDLLDEAAEELGSFEAELDRVQRVLIETLRQFKVEARPGGRKS